MKIADRQRLCSMIKGFFVLLLMAFLAACGGGQVIPDWTVTAYNRLEDFKKAYLEGDVRIADLHFRKAVEEIKKSGDGEILAKAYLTRMAVERAALDPVGEEGFLKADAVTSSAENRSFYNLLRGRFDVVQADVLPPQY
ncbi:MAG: hypothetical protein N2Z74_09845, partial [Syntrophales bacterium]|nr:hypothetical protein [Syntrophales bacterium]